MHDVYVVGIPVLVILIGILVNKHDVSVLRGEMRTGFSDIKAQTQHLIDLHIDHESRISKVEERTK
jgi:hypothetical protein